jgi:hypothetical protein
MTERAATALNRSEISNAHLQPIEEVLREVLPGDMSRAGSICNARGGRTSWLETSSHRPRVSKPSRKACFKDPPKRTKLAPCCLVAGAQLHHQAE